MHPPHAQASTSAATHSNVTLTLTHELPLQIRRRWVEKRLVLGGGAVPKKMDRALLKAVARAHCWLEDFISGRVDSMTAIAQRAQTPELTTQTLVTRKTESCH